MSAGFHDRSLSPSRNANLQANSSKTQRTSLFRSFLSSSSSPKYHKLQQKHGTSNNFHRTYVHGHVDSSLEDDEDEDNIFELPEIRSRKGPGNSKISDPSTSKPYGTSEMDYLQHTVTDVDTVQSLSIKYSCPVAELKRVNHLIRDQDLFGRKLVKVPIRKYGHITEVHSDLLITDSNTLDSTTHNAPTGLVDCSDEMTPGASNSVDNESCNLSDPDMQRKIIQSLSIKDMIHPQTKSAEEFLRSMDRDLEVIRNSTKTSCQSLNEVISVLTNKSIQPLQKPNNVWSCSEEGCGLRYKTIVAAVVFIGIVVPIFIIIYFKYHKPD
ncbi:lysM and putative peptidoglycan-binding domain-containing protein 3 [Octopus sinensis]|uniref:LysM and putative peptidoglycan-binding domain-containing protein 3 n=1 Tax=Octopus sinensis TaxID=2607531 RepID=A0A6P7S7G9_9MOLL|nr:lysM and putative peptidoglycan-binding domain-containing protein 3 [Octopus sinensis]